MFDDRQRGPQFNPGFDGSGDAHLPSGLPFIHSPEAQQRELLRFTLANEIVERIREELGPKGYMPNEREVIYLCIEAQDFLKFAARLSCTIASTVDAPLVITHHSFSALDAHPHGEDDCFKEEYVPHFNWEFDYAQFVLEYVAKKRQAESTGKASPEIDKLIFYACGSEVFNSEHPYFRAVGATEWHSWENSIKLFQNEISARDFKLLILPGLKSEGHISADSTELTPESHQAAVKVALEEIDDCIKGQLQGFALANAPEIGFVNALRSSDLYKQLKEQGSLEDPTARKALAFAAVNECSAERVASAKELGFNRVDASIQHITDALERATKLIKKLEGSKGPAVVLESQRALVKQHELILSCIGEFKPLLERYFSS